MNSWEMISTLQWTRLTVVKEKLAGPEREERRSSPAEEVVEAILGLDYSRSAQTSPEVSPAEARNLLDSEFKTRMDRSGFPHCEALIVLTVGKPVVISL